MGTTARPEIRRIPSERAFFAVSMLLFAASATATIVWPASMLMPGQTWLAAAASSSEGGS
jgi:hypothetical protein